MIGFISEKLLIPILDFFYGLVPSYGLAIVAFTVVIRIALFPLSAGSIRSARRMKIAQPVMQKRQAEIKSKFSGDPKKQQEELGKLMNEFGSPLAGCLPLIVQMPVLFALFATLRGSPFADVPYNINLKVAKSAKRTGICTIKGKQPASGLPNSFINFPSSSCCFLGSPENFDFISACLFCITGWAIFILLALLIEPALKGKSAILITTVNATIAKP